MRMLSGHVGAPTTTTTTKPQVKIDDKTTMMKKVEDYFMGGVACKTLVGVMRNVKIVRDDKTGKIVDIIGLENANDCASGAMIFNTGDSKTSLARPQLQYGSMVVGDAIKAAVKDYEAKKAKLSDQSENATADARFTS
ncbi:iron-sulfur cluster assembly protein 1-like [Capsicum galapagoense]